MSALASHAPSQGDPHLTQEVLSHLAAQLGPAEQLLEIVIEQLSSYEQEYKEIVKAQATEQSAPSRK